MTNVKFLFGVLMLNHIYALVNAECPDGWVAFKGSCYLHSSSKLTFQESEEFCKHHGAHLVNIGTATENIFVKSYLSDLKDSQHWIGLKDDVIEGLWQWYDTDTTASFTNWASNQPNDGKTGNCVAIYGSYGYNWVDIPCAQTHNPLCEKR